MAKKMAKWKDQVVEVISEPKGGWQKVKLEDGTEKNVRPKELEMLPERSPGRRAEDQPKQARVGNVVQAQKDRYVVGLGETPSGRSTMDIDDEVAKQLRGLTLDETYDVAAAFMREVGLDITADSLRERYGHLNQGMQRMNLGNRMRGAYSAYEKQMKKEQAKKEREEAKAKKDAKKAEEKQAKKSAAKGPKCPACEGTGKNSKGGVCSPCKGTGIKKAKKPAEATA